MTKLTFMCYIKNENTRKALDLKAKATVEILNKFSGQNEVFRNYININDMKYFKIPRGICLKEFGTCKTVLKDPKQIDFKLKSNFEMRPEQFEIVENISKTFQENKTVNTIIIRPTAFGKTFTAVNCISKLKLKTLIVVNRDSLVKQWKKQCQDYFPENTVGLLQGQTRELDADIIITTVQTISLKSELSETLLNSLKIGILIIDEIHTISADKFIKVLFKSNMPVRIGLTATLERIDCKEQLVIQHLSNLNQIKHVKKQQETMVHFVKTGYPFTVIPNEFSDKMNYSLMLNKLSLDESRNNLIVEEIKKYIGSENHILVVSDRISQLEYLHSFFKDISTICTSKTKPDFTKQIVFGITSIVGTGLDIPTLNVLVFAMPKKNIVQILGRVFRKKHPQVHILDFIDSSGIGYSQSKKRKEQYISQIGNPIFR